MPEPNESTVESRFLDQHPELRARITSNTEFTEWKQRLQTVEIDGDQFYIRGGDMLRDENQIIFEWAWEKGLVTQEDLKRFESPR